MRKILAFIIAPLMPAAMQILLPVIISQSWPFNQTDYKIILVVSTIISAVGLLLIGIPSVIWLSKFNQLNLYSLSLVGGISGAVVFYLFGLLLTYVFNSTSSYGLYAFLYRVVLGFSVAISFGVISGITNTSSCRKT